LRRYIDRRQHHDPRHACDQARASAVIGCRGERKQHYRDGCAERPDGDQAVGPEKAGEPWQRECGPDGACPDRAEQNAVKRRTAANLVAGNERKQRPIGARE